MKAFINISILLILPFIVFSQNPKKAFKKLEDKDYTEAKVIFNQILSENENDVAANYGMAVIYSQDSKVNFDLFKARNYIITANNNFDKIDPNELSKLDKYISEDIIQNAVKRIEAQLAEYVKSQSDIELSKKYIRQCKGSEFYNEILSFLHKQEYKKALEFNSELALKEFLENYPEAEQAGQAQEHIFNLAWKKANEKASVQSYRDFMRKYPTASQYDIALDKIREIEFKNAMSMGTDDAYNNFLEKYPDSKQADKLLIDWENRFYKQAKSIRTVSVYNKYLSKFPESERAEEIEDLRNKLEFERAQKSNTQEAYAEFVKRYPNAKQINQALEKLNKFSYSKAELDYFEKRNQRVNLGIESYVVYKSYEGDTTQSVYEKVIYDRYGNEFRKTKILNQNNTTTTVFKYEENGDLMSQKAEFKNDQLNFDITKEYNSENLCEKEIHKCYNECELDSVLVVNLNYDENRNLIKKTIYNSNESVLIKSVSFTYDNNNQLIQKKISSDTLEVKIPKINFQYDTRGNLVQKTEFANDNSILSVVSYDYQNDKLMKSTHNDVLGKYSKEYSYDHRGILKRIDVIFEKEQEQNYTLNYVYSWKAQ
jgi:outer membrane protein assembly factor BamD (BamD/ComL family)